MSQNSTSISNALTGVCDTINKIFEANSGISNSIGKSTKEEHIAAVKESANEQDEPCVCGACVMCSNAVPNSKPVHILKAEKQVDISGLNELNKKDIVMDEPFMGCI